MVNDQLTVTDTVVYQVTAITVREYLDNHRFRRFMEDLKDEPHTPLGNMVYLDSLSPNKKIYVVESSEQQRTQGRRT